MHIFSREARLIQRDHAIEPIIGAITSRSKFAPHRITALTLPVRLGASTCHAAWANPADPSTSIFYVHAMCRIPSAICSSVQSINSSMTSQPSGNVIDQSSTPPAQPSAMVSVCVTSTLRPALMLAAMAIELIALTPTSRVVGENALRTAPMPEIRPPPPIET